MKLTFLGTASCFPTPSRGVSCTALSLDEGTIWLFDCGEGSQIQLQKCQNLRPGKVTKIFVTHLHGDHLFGLPGLLCTLGNGTKTSNDEKVVDIYGPHGIRKYLVTSLELSRSVPSLKFNVYELMPVKSQLSPDWSEWNTDFEYSGQSGSKVGEVLYRKIYPEKICTTNRPIAPLSNENGGLFDEYNSQSRNESANFIWNVCEFGNTSCSVQAGALKHRIPSYGYVITERDKPGKLDALKLQKDYDVKPGPVYGKIKSGKLIKLDDGRTINPEEYLSPSSPGRKIAIFGDTYDSYHMSSICEGSDLLVHEATLENALYSKAIEYGHSTPEMAAKFASFVNAKKLCLSHLSPRYKTQSKEYAYTNEGSANLSQAAFANILKDEAEQYLNSVNSKIKVILAEDFLVVPVLKLGEIK